MSGEITAADLDHFERTLEALALECKITDEHMFNMLAIHGACIAAAVDKEREACAKVAESYYRKSTFNSRVRSLGQDAADGIASAIRNRTT